ncbi:ricin-type beta-trefoil lectin domain protein [Streptomyces lunaelactis]|uniref:ricin-type beta-trefoil lectin domain protein n=1 Tax=Streptomyces lunaelactis TaxID=1535768 RepID=UPI00158500B5|nr:ricin-type beta-trefoil lectin domain protein [Streptomyces lunaelactis]NUK53081.1 ricin-type beta-trefoil lectin domain protein [Streptomyces lunaelactis]NUK63372.1 ricin-type beta-trefoil lectin domain protein [Streptomyces lunaelactis]
MTRSAPQPPISPRAESGSDGEETAATAAVAEPAPAPAPKTEPNSEPAEAKSGAEAGTKLAEAEETAAQGSTTEPEGGAGSETGTSSESGAASGSQSEAEGDPSAAAAAKSRLPALVRTMTVTAIDRPQQQAGPVGRPGKAVLAGAAVAGALLLSVPFLMLGGNDDKDRRGPASAGTVLGGNAQDAPGEFATTTPDTGSSGDGKKDPDQQGKQKEPVKEASASAPVKGGDKGEGRPKDAGTKDQPEKQSGGKQSDGRKDQPAKAGSGVTLSAPVSLRSHLSGRCIDVPGGDFSDGKQLIVWDCNNGPAQKWQFASDGTVRIKGKCLDVANANYNDGTPIQIAWCSGNAAQKFVLNASHDLVNTVVGKCVDIKDNNRGSGARLQLWSCAGTDNQKWSV